MSAWHNGNHKIAACTQVSKTTQDVSCQHYSPVVEQLKNIISAVPRLETILKKMLHSRPEGDPWYRRSVNDVYAYLNHLLKEPLISSEPEKGFFYLRSSVAGRHFFDNPKIRSWFERFFRQIG